MTIKVTWATILGVAAVATSAYIAYKAVSDLKKEEEKFEEHKKETIGDRDLLTEINDASHYNEKFEDPQTKADAFLVMENLLNKVKATKKIADFDTAFKNYDEAYQLLTGRDKDQATSMLIVYKDRYDRERDARRLASTREYELSRDSERNKAEVKKAKIISDAIRNANKIVLSGDEWSRKRAINNAVNNLADLTVTINKAR